MLLAFEGHVLLVLTPREKQLPKISTSSPRGGGFGLWAVLCGGLIPAGAAQGNQPGGDWRHFSKGQQTGSEQGPSELAIQSGLANMLRRKPFFRPSQEKHKPYVGLVPLTCPPPPGPDSSIRSLSQRRGAT